LQNKRQYKTINRINVSEQVMKQMIEMLSSGIIKPGDRFTSENELAKQLGVSRVSVRAAIHQLVGMGVLIVRHGDGTFVSDSMGSHLHSRLLSSLLTDKIQLQEVLEFRLIVEVGAAKMAAEKSHQEDIALLRECELDMAKSFEDVSSFAMHDLKYHNALALISGNSLMIRTIALLQEIYSAAMTETIKIRGSKAGIFNHKLLTDAIEAHDIKLAEQLMTEHIQSVIEHLKETHSKGVES